MIMTHTAVAVNDEEMAQEIGYSLYISKRSITRCDNVEQARGWLLAQWQHDCAEAALWGERCRALHPRHLSDADVLGIIAQAEEIAEVQYWTEMSHGL